MNNMNETEEENLRASQVITIDNQMVIFDTSENMLDVMDGSVDLFVTSPPYWNLKDYGDSRQIGTGSYARYLERLNIVWGECYNKGKDNSILAINVNSRRFRKRFYPIPIDIVSQMSQWTLWDIIIWYVPNALPQPRYYIERLFDNKFEFVLIFTKNHYTDYVFHKPRVPQKYKEVDHRSHKKNPKGRCLGNVIRIPAYRPPNVKQMNYHISAFPEELVALLIATYTEETALILDPFLGSGTTLKVAQAMKRKGIGYETNSNYKDLIVNKIKENWQLPDWRDIDMIHSIRFEPGMIKPRKNL
jgi:modification methylase